MEEKILRVIQLMQELGVTAEDLKNYWKNEKKKKANLVTTEASPREDILDIVMKKLDLSADEISDNSKFLEDLGADSLDTVEILMDVENKFHIIIPDEECEGIKTFGDLLTATKKHL